MNHVTKIITMLALLIVGVFLGYLRNEDKNTTPIDDHTLVYDQDTEVVDDTVADNTQLEGEDSLESDDLESDNTEDDLADEETEELTDTTYTPTIVNIDQEADLSGFPTYDESFTGSLTDVSVGDSPSVTYSQKPTETISKRFKLKGKMPANVERVDVIRDGDYQPFTLKKFAPGKQNFEYNINPQYDNVTEGENRYLIRGYAGDTIYHSVVTVTYDPAPSAQDLDSSFAQ